MIWPWQRDQVLTNLITFYENRIQVLEKRCDAQDKTMEAFRIRLSAPAAENETVISDTNWLERRRRLEAEHSGGKNAEQGSMARNNTH